MIIELFGPQGVGKTTFARALAAQLQERHQIVDLVLSHRPAERLGPNTPLRDPPSDGATAVAIRLIRPVVELLTMTRHPAASSHDVKMASNLMRALPPKRFLSSIRLSQYLLRLSRSWHLAAASDHIALFDQAFVQAVCSLALFCEAADEVLIAHALDLIPKPDMLIQLEAPASVLTNRLCDRQRLQSLLERMFEIDPKTTIEANQIFDQLRDLFRKRGQAVISVSSSDPHSVAHAANRIAETIAADAPPLYQARRVVPAGISSEECHHV